MKAIQIVAQIVLQLAVSNGIGYHTADALRMGKDIVSGLKWAAIYQILTVASSAVGKLAIMAFLMQIRGLQNHRPWFFWILGALLIGVNVADIGTMLGQCQPVRKWWDLNAKGTCDPGKVANERYSWFQGGVSSLHNIVGCTI